VERARRLSQLVGLLAFGLSFNAIAEAAFSPAIDVCGAAGSARSGGAGGEAVAVWSHPDDVSSHERIQASVGP
jgi:hypothetical protein